ncbi:MAG: hypothetical protein ACRDBH_09700, partial [Bosea sp. (in: a-proteobacteria)]
MTLQGLIAVFKKAWITQTARLARWALKVKNFHYFQLARDYLYIFSVCRISVVSLLIGAFLLSVPQARDLFIDISYLPSNGQQSLLPLAWEIIKFQSLILLGWALPVFFAARWSLRNEDWQGYFDDTGNFLETEQEVKRRRQLHIAVIWVPRIMAMGCFLLVLNGLSRAGENLFDPTSNLSSGLATTHLRALLGSTVITAALFFWLMLRGRAITNWIFPNSVLPQPALSAAIEKEKADRLKLDQRSEVIDEQGEPFAPQVTESSPFLAQMHMRALMRHFNLMRPVIVKNEKTKEPEIIDIYKTEIDRRSRRINFLESSYFWFLLPVVIVIAMAISSLPTFQRMYLLPLILGLWIPVFYFLSRVSQMSRFPVILTCFGLLLLAKALLGDNHEVAFQTFKKDDIAWNDLEALGRGYAANAKEKTDAELKAADKALKDLKTPALPGQNAPPQTSPSPAGTEEALALAKRRMVEAELASARSPAPQARSANASFPSAPQLALEDAIALWRKAQRRPEEKDGYCWIDHRDDKDAQKPQIADGSQLVPCPAPVARILEDASISDQPSGLQNCQLAYAPSGNFDKTHLKGCSFAIEAVMASWKLRRPKGEFSEISNPLLQSVQTGKCWVVNSDPEADRANLAACPPPIIVAAAGGASRAAFMTVSVLGHMLDATCPDWQRDGNPAARENSFCTQRPVFADRLFAISGVSGGSLGASVYAAAWARATHATHGQFRHPCATIGEGNPVNLWFRSRAPKNWRECLQLMTVGDFLSPVTVGMAFRDFFSFLQAPYRDRAALLEESWEATFSAAIGKEEAGPLLSDPFSAFLPSLDSCKTFDSPDCTQRPIWRPLLLLNGTSATTGRRIITSHLKPVYSDPPPAASPAQARAAALTRLVAEQTQRPFEVPSNRRLFPDAYDLYDMVSVAFQRRARAADDGLEGKESCRELNPRVTMPPNVGDIWDVSLATATSNSARFPIVSPAGTISCRSTGFGYFSSPSDTIDRIIDGGYFENFGATTSLDLAVALQKKGLKPIVLLITNEPMSERDASVLVRGHDRAPGIPDATDTVAAPWLTTTFSGLSETRNARGTDQVTKLLSVVNPDRKSAGLWHIGLIREDNVHGGAKSVSMSWWLSKPVQEYIDNQLPLAIGIEAKGTIRP